MAKPTKQQQLEAKLQKNDELKIERSYPGHLLCAMRTSVNILTGKWKLLVLSYIMEKPQRYGELRRLVPEATEKMIVHALRELEQDEIIVRKSFAEVPPRVEYSLTEQGKLLKPVVKNLLQWGDNYITYKTAKRKSSKKVA